MLGSVTLRAQLRPAPLAAAAPARAGAVSLRAAPRCVAYSAVSAERLPPSQVRKVSFDGAAAGEATLALKTAKEATAVGLVHRYLVLVRQNARRGTASTLTRSEVRGGGKKPYDQKGSGNARRGSTRSPLIRGGGVAFGPKPRDWSIKMNKKERRLAMATALQTAASSITVVDDLTPAAFPERKTKPFAAALQRWGVAPGEHALLITKEVVSTVAASARNIGGLVHSPVEKLSVYDVLRADKLIVEASALEHLNAWYGAEGAAWA